MAVAFGQRTDLKPSRQRTEAEILQPVGNLLIQIAESLDLYWAVMDRYTRIVRRLDNGAIEATDEQRMEAEAKVSALFAESRRYTQVTERKLKAFRNEWAELPKDLQQWICEEALPMACWDRIRPLISGITNARKAP